jgi:hypothetical protein
VAAKAIALGNTVAASALATPFKKKKKKKISRNQKQIQISINIRRRIIIERQCNLHREGKFNQQRNDDEFHSKLQILYVLAIQGSKQVFKHNQKIITNSIKP